MRFMSAIIVKKINVKVANVLSLIMVMNVEVVKKVVKKK